MKHNNKGYTLLEVMGSVIILAIAVLGITFILQQSTISSKQNEDANQAIHITRPVMEEIKQNLKASNSITVYGQSVNLLGLKQNTPPYPPQPIVISYPNTTSPEFEIRISTVPIPDSVFTAGGKSIDISTYFRIIHIETVELSSNRVYELESYVEYNT